MRRSEAEHVPRAAAAIAQEQSFVVIGSQAVLFLLPYAPEALLVSRELDLYPALHPEKADLIDGAIGALSSFDDTFGYHADGVGPETAVMPADWMARSSLHYVGELTVICPELHDLAVSKCVAGRDKDAEFVEILLHEKLIDPDVMRLRLHALDATRHPVEPLLGWLQRRIVNASSRATP
ncbi:MAG: hypothetical protein JWQ41_193 [Variovorax sp.]|nr:hypothetical protein [Variovorax sp.]